MASGVDGQPLLQVPRHEFRVVDDGTSETVEISVQLPGVRSASDISVRIEPPHTVTVHVPHRYALTLPLAVPIASRADVVRFRTKNGKLHMSCRVLTPEEAAAQAAEAAAAQPTAAAAPSGSSSDTAQLVTQSSTVSRDGSRAAAAGAAAGDTSGGSSSSSGAQQQQQQQQQPAADVLQSFLPAPTKAERRRMEQEEQRRKQEAEQRRREEEAAAAAEAERQRAAEAAAAARRAAEQKRREEAARKAAAKAAAAEEAQRREQQRKLNKAAAEEWLSRGHAAIAQEDIPAATKALNKAKELDPANTTGAAKLNKELAALRQKAAAAAAAAAGGRRGSSSSPGPGDSSGGANGRQQQQQQQQQQQPYWEQRRAVGHGVKDEWVQDMLDNFSAGGHTPGPVGMWCHWVYLLCYWVMWAGQVAIEWAESVPPSRVRCGAAGRSFLWCVVAGGRLLTFAGPLGLILWREAWGRPLAVVAYVRRVGGDSHLEAAEWRADWEEWLSSVEDVRAGFTKLALAGSTGGTVYAAFWATCRLSFGPHSLLGWAWALMGWVWRVVAWDPSYALQMVAAGAGTGFCSVARPGPCWLTLYPLQVLLSDRGWGTLLSLGASILYSSTVADWRPSWRQQQYKAPWWQAGLVTVVPTLVTRSISRLGIGWVFLLPVRLLATLLGYPGRLLLGLVRVPLAHGLGAVVVVAPSAAAAVWPGWALRAGASVVCSLNTTRYPAAACSHLTTAAAAHASLPPYPHGFVWDVGLFLWMFYVISVITDWEDQFGKEYYSQQRRERQSQQQQKQRRRQQQQQQPGSDEEAEQNSLGDKQSDFPMGFGSVAVPKGCEVASVRAVLEATDYYKVMGYSSHDEVTAESLKTKRRQLVLAVHPDKVGHDHPGANQAAGRVNKAYETLSTPSMRSAYDSILANHSRGSGRRAAAAAGGSSSSSGGGAAGGGGWVQEYSDALFERPPAEDKFMCQDMGCPGCGGHHTTYILPKAPFGVRWCAECKDWHPVGKGEVWAHWSPGPLGMAWLGGARLLLCADPDGPTYDVTELFRCKEAAGILPKDMSRCNTHFNPFMAASSGYGGGGGRSGGGGSGGTPRRRKKGRRR